MLAREPPDPTTERKAADPGLGDDACRDDASVLRGSDVDVPKQTSPLDLRDTLCGVDLDATHSGEVDGQPTVDQSLARDAMAAAANRDLQVVPPSDFDARHHVVGACTS